MRKSSCTVIAALALSVLCDTGARASVPHAASVPGEVTATECVAGGGVIVISADGDGSGAFTTLCQGGIHDGQAVT
ncbi:hypothetical protein ACWEN4_00255 [Streptomyces violaceorubidus]